MERHGASRAAVDAGPGPGPGAGLVSRVQTMLRLGFRHTFGASSLRWVSLIGSASIVFTVLVLGIVSGLVQFAPLLVTRLAELNLGETDLIFVQQGYSNFADAQTARTLHGLGQDQPVFVNYTKVQQTLEADEKLSFHSPRWLVTGEVRAYKDGLGLGASLADVEIQGIDSAAEHRMGLGVTWPYGSQQIPPNSCILPSEVADFVGVEVGDQVSLTFLTWRLLEGFGLYKRPQVVLPSAEVETEPTSAPEVDSDGLFPITIQRTVSGTINKFYAKFDSTGGARKVGALNEFDDLEVAIKSAILDSVPLGGDSPVGRNMDPAEVADRIRNVNLRDFVSAAFVNLPPADRSAAYRNTNIRKTRQSLLSFTTKATGQFLMEGIRPIQPLSDQIEDAQFLSLFLGLLVTLAVVIFLILGLVMMYSLFMYSVDVRTYEIGVLRLLGAGKIRVVELILAQVFIIGVPSWVVGLVLAQLAFLVVVAVIGGALGVEIPKRLPALSIGISCLTGLAMPVVASLLPIKRALLFEPREAFRTQRPRNNAVSVSVVRETHTFSAQAILISVVMIAFGFMIYYLFILALFSTDISLLLNIFLVLLVGMLLSISIIFLNFNLPLTFLVKFLLFFWERSHVNQIAKKNLISHQKRNRKIFLVFTLAVSLVVYLAVVAELQVKSIEGFVEKSVGVSLAVTSSEKIGEQNTFDCCREDLETIVQDFEQYIDGFSWISSSSTKSMGSTSISNLGRAFQSRIDLIAILPNFLDTVFPVYNAFEGDGDDQFRQMYSLRGMQGAHILDENERDLGVQKTEDFLLDFDINEPRVRLTQNSNIVSLAGIDKDRFSRRGAVLSSFTLMTGIGSVAGLGSIDDLPMRSFIVKVDTKKIGKTEYRSLVRNVTGVSARSEGLDVIDVESSRESLRTVISLLRSGFVVLSALAVFVCGFSFITAMLANAKEQVKEIAVLRAIGIRSWDLFRIGLVESVSMVIAAVFAGVTTGWAVGLGSGIQQNLFLDLPTGFVVPVSPILVVVPISLVSALLGAVAFGLTAKNEVTTELRAV